MKLRLPKLLLSAVLAWGAMAQAVTFSQDLFKAVDVDEDGFVSRRYDGSSHITVLGNCELKPEDMYTWGAKGSDIVILDGPGRLYTSMATEVNPELFYGDLSIFAGSYTGEGAQVNKVILGKNLVLDFVYLDIGVGNYYGAPVTVDVNSTFVNGSILEVYGDKVTVDISDAVFEYGELGLAGSTYRCEELVVSPKLLLSVDAVDGNSNRIYGNLTLNGGGVVPANGNSVKDYYDDAYAHGAFTNKVRSIWGGVTFRSNNWEGNQLWGSVNVTGHLKVTRETGVWFASSLDDSKLSFTGSYEYYSGYQVPSANDSLFICGSVDAKSLSKLKAYSFREHCYRDKYGDDVSEWVDYKVLNGEFVARANMDGKVHVYYCQNGKQPNDSTAGAIKVPTGKLHPFDSSSTKPYYIDGGTLDATKAGAYLDTAQIAGGAGVLKTTQQQTLTNSNGYSLGYNVEGGADMRFIEGVPTLNGTKYETSTTSVEGSAFLIVGENAVLGAGADSELVLSSGSQASTTNFGKIMGKVRMGEGSTFLNQGTIDGLVDMAENSVFTNNGTITGDVDIVTHSYLYGSGSFEGTTTVQEDGLLYVGNSPGYQKHKNLRLAGGATLGFTVDGAKPASAADSDTGTHSFMSVSGNLTLDGVVNVNIDVTGGIATAGRTPFTLTLLKVDNPANITTTNDGTLKGTITSGEDLLEKDSVKIEWNEKDGELLFSGQVTEEAIAAYEEWLRTESQTTQDCAFAESFANTLWASTAALKDFADTAGQQLLIGTPGQTTAWGAVIGTFLDHDDFTYEGSGYAVGLQHAYTEQFRAGVSLGQTFGDFKCASDTMTSEQSGIMAAVTAQYVEELNKGISSWGINGYIAYGNVENEAKTTDGGKAEWDDSAITLGARAQYCTAIGENTTATLFAGLEYMRGWQDDIDLRYGESSITLRDGTMQNLSLPLGVTLRTETPVGCSSVLAPEVTVAYIADIYRRDPRLKVEGSRVTGSSPARNAFMLNVGANLLIDQNWSVGLFYNMEARSDMLNHSGNFAVRYAF